MNEENNGPLDISCDTSSVSTATQMVAANEMARFRLKSVTKVASKEGKPMLKWEYDLVAPAKGQDGATIEPGGMGSKFFENIALFDKNTPEGTVPAWALKRIAQRQDALLGTGDANNTKGKPSRPAFNASCVEAMQGKELIAKMKSGQEGYSNEFGTIYFPGDVTA